MLKRDSSRRIKFLFHKSSVVQVSLENGFFSIVKFRFRTLIVLIDFLNPRFESGDFDHSDLIPITTAQLSPGLFLSVSYMVFSMQVAAVTTPSGRLSIHRTSVSKCIRRPRMFSVGQTLAKANRHLPPLGRP